jgi:1-deoxyxylulose-5-phosphate synthase
LIGLGGGVHLGGKYRRSAGDGVLDRWARSCYKTASRRSRGGPQPRYNLLFRQVERELFPLCAEEGLGVIPYNPIAGGLLSGKHRREAGPMPDTRFTHPTAGARYRDRYWRERELETVEALRPLATEAGMSMTQMAVAWVLENPVVTAPIVGASRPEQLDDALAAVDKGLDESLKARLDELTREYRWGDDIR